MSHFSRLPVRFLESNNELLKAQTDTDVSSFKKATMNREDVDLAKSQEALSGGHADAGTNHVATETIPVAEMRVEFRAPRDRNLGNVLFRRNPDSTLDFDAAKHVVVDAIHCAIDAAGVEGLLNDLDKMVLSVFFPAVYMYVDPGLLSSMAAVHMRLAPHEIDTVRMLVAAHLRSEMSYNAGLGGFPTDHRRV